MDRPQIEFTRPSSVLSSHSHQAGLLIFHKVMDTSLNLCYFSSHEATRNFR